MRYARTIGILLTAYFLSSHSLLMDSPVVDIERDIKIVLTEQAIPPIPAGNFNSFISRMGELESNNNYNVVNQYGYMGKYQFATSTLRALKSLGYLDITDREIVSYTRLHEVQERSMVALTTSNYDYLKRNDLLSYVGENIGGVKITRDGLLAGMHLRGAYAVRQYLESNGRINKHDGNNTTVKDYIKHFV